MAVIGDNSQTGNFHATNLTLTGSAQIGTTVFASLGAGSNGSLVYCSDCTQTTPCTAGGNGAMATYANGTWTCGAASAGPFASGTLTLVEDFMPTRSATGYIGALGWSIVPLGTGYAATPVSGIDNHPGVFKCLTNASSGDGCSITLTDSNEGAFYPISNMGAGGAFASWEMQAIIGTDQYSVTHSKYFVGFSDNQAAYHPANGNSIAVRYDSAGGGCGSGDSTANWVFEVSVGGTKTCLNSGLPAAINTWYKMRIYSTTPGTINFQINGANGGTITTAPTANLTPQFLVQTTGGYQTMNVDWFAFNMTGLNR